MLKDVTFPTWYYVYNAKTWVDLKRQYRTWRLEDLPLYDDCLQRWSVAMHEYINKN